MKNGILFFLILFLVACSENSSSAGGDCLSSQGTVVEERIIPQISIEDNARSYLRDTLGVSEAKVVFRNDLSGNLVYVLFEDDSVHSVEFLSALDVYHPVISPNGKWVAFCTKAEAIGLSSHVYVQALDSDDDSRMMIAENSAIPRWRVLPSGDTVLIYVSCSGLNRNDDFWYSQYTKMVPFMRGKLGTAKKLFTGNYHGGVSENLRFAVTGAPFLRVRSELEGKFKDAIWYDSSQVCNASLSTDGSMQTSDVHEKVLLVDVRDSSVHPLVSGSDLWHPDVWLRK